MPRCAICGEALPDGARTCSVCGTSIAEVLPFATVIETPTQRKSFLAPASLAPGGRFCPGCGKTYDPEFADSFCICGVELQAPTAAPAPGPTHAPGRAKPQRPPAGTRCVTLYGPDRQPLAYFPLPKDAMLIGRLDAPAGNFPDIDLDEWLEPAQARKISRQHALILHTRSSDQFALRPLPGNTGTQIEADLVPAGIDYPLSPGRRFILGGVARFKFEMM
jgi:hypothetical protein